MQILAIYPPHVFPRGSLLLLTANGSSHEQGDHDYLVLPYCLGQNPTAAETTAAQPFFVRLFSSSPLVVIPETFSDGVSAHRALALGALHEALIVYSPSRGVNMHARMAGEAALHGKLKRRIAGGGKGTCSFGGGGGSGSGGGGGGGGGGASRSSSSSESTALSAALSACSVLTVTGDGAVAILGVNRSDASATFEVDSYVKVPSPLPLPHPCPLPSSPTCQRASASPHLSRSTCAVRPRVCLQTSRRWPTPFTPADVRLKRSRSGGRRRRSVAMVTTQAGADQRTSHTRSAPWSLFLAPCLPQTLCSDHSDV